MELKWRGVERGVRRATADQTLQQTHRSRFDLVIQFLFLFHLTGRLTAGCMLLLHLLLLLTLAVGLMEASASASVGRNGGGQQQHRRVGNDPADAAARLAMPNAKILLMNNLLDELDDSLPECSAAFRRVQDAERAAHSPYPPDIKGSWVSQE